MNNIDFNVIAANIITDIFSDAYKSAWNWFGEKGKEKDYLGIAARKYAGKLYGRYNSIRVFGMTDDVPLDTLFVRVNILDKIQTNYRDSVQFLEENFDRDKRIIKFGNKRTTKTGIETINKLNKMIVLGKPGAGKSTYLKFLALQSIKKNSKIKKKRVPVFISLKELADKNIWIMKFIEYQFNICSLEDASLFIESLLQNGKCLILLDGLDEVQEDRKSQMIQEIIDFSEKYSDNQFVISCRVAAYNSWFKKFADVEMADFNDSQIKEFILKWFHNEPDTAEKCWIKLEKEITLKELATTPLLLTLLCIAYNENLDFHTNKAELYEEAINALLKKWDSTRRIEKRFEPYKSLSLSRKRALLNRIAVQTFTKGKYFLKRREIVKLISDYIKNIPSFDLTDLDEAAENILDAIIANHGILVPRAKGIYSFAHLTFQEYFTAKYIVEHTAMKTPSILVEKYINDDKWREVFLLTASMLDEADNFILSINEQSYRIIKKHDYLFELMSTLDRLLTNPESRYHPSILKAYSFFAILIYASGNAENLDPSMIFSSTKNLQIATDQVLILFRELGTILSYRNENVFDINLVNVQELENEIELNLYDEIDMEMIESLGITLKKKLDFLNAKNHLAGQELLDFIQIKKRVLECLNTECYISLQKREWLIQNIFEVSDNN